MCLSPYSRSFLPIELDTAEKKAMVTVSVVEAPVHGLQAGRGPTEVLGTSPYGSMCREGCCVVP